MKILNESSNKNMIRNFQEIKFFIEMNFIWYEISCEIQTLVYYKNS